MNLTSTTREALRYLLQHPQVSSHVPNQETRKALRATGIVMNIPGLDEIMCLRPTSLRGEYHVPFRDAELEAALLSNKIFTVEIDGNGDEGFYVVWP